MAIDIMRFKDNNDVNSEILGTRIRVAREKLGISQGELADLVAKDQGAISEYENGKRRLAAVDLPSFARALDVPVSYFYEGEQALADLDDVLLSAFHTIPSRTLKQAAIEIVQVLART